MNTLEAAHKLSELLNPGSPKRFHLDYDFDGKIWIQQNTERGRKRKIIQLDEKRDYTPEQIQSLKERVTEFFEDDNNFL